jgi:hypothetical protein
MGIIPVLYGWLLRLRRVSHRSGFGRKLDTFSVTIWVYNQRRHVLKYERCVGSVQNIEHTQLPPIY